VTEDIVHRSAAGYTVSSLTGPARVWTLLFWGFSEASKLASRVPRYGRAHGSATLTTTAGSLNSFSARFVLNPKGTTTKDRKLHVQEFFRVLSEISN